MEHKICTKCKQELEATQEFFYRQKMGKYGITAFCKKCVYKERKIRSKNPEVLKKNRLLQAKWRKNNYKKDLEIGRKHYNKHKIKINKQRKKRYAEDEEYRARRKEVDKKYNDSGRKFEISRKPENMIKQRKRRKKRYWNNRKSELIEAKKYRKNNIKKFEEYSRKRTKELPNNYVAHCIKGNNKFLNITDIPQEIIETKRLIIKIRREIKMSINN